MLTLTLLFIVLPAIELGLLIRIGSFVGVLPTLGLIVLTGVLGAALAKQQGLSTLRGIQQATARGEMPVDQLVDGALILFAGALLLTPGFLTDAFGFLALVPGSRQMIKQRLKSAIRERVREGRIHVDVHGVHGTPGPMPRAPSQGPVVDTELAGERPARRDD